jgi:hypothetical protein
MKTIEFKAIECRSALEALRIADESECGKAILLNGMHYAIFRPEAERLEAAGVEFAYLGVMTLPDGEQRIVTVPVN